SRRERLIATCPSYCRLYVRRIASQSQASHRPHGEFDRLRQAISATALPGQRPDSSAKKAGTRETSSTVRTVERTPRPCSLSRSHNPSPSTRSIGGAPCRWASARASPVNDPVVTGRPFSPPPAIAARDSPTTPAPALSGARRKRKNPDKLTSDRRRTPAPA